MGPSGTHVMQRSDSGLHHLPSDSSETPERSQSSRLENSHLCDVDDYELHPSKITNAQELCAAI
jgi:hypothetical protein